MIAINIDINLFIIIFIKEYTNILILISQQFSLCLWSIDEFSLFCLADCTMEEYIARHEPPTILGRESELIFKFGRIDRNVYLPLNEHISKTVEKDIYSMLAVMDDYVKTFELFFNKKNAE